MDEFSPTRSTRPGARSIEAIKEFCSQTKLDTVRSRFVQDITMTPAVAAFELGAPETLVMDLILNDKWLEDRKRYHKVNVESEIMQYQSLIKEERLPAVIGQLSLMKRLDALIGQSFTALEKAYEVYNNLPEDASPQERRAAEARIPSAKELLDLAGTCEKANAIAGRLLNIRENLFERDTGGGQSGNNFFILPGTFPTRTDPNNIIDVTP
jgi:hypothetical protein